MSYLSHAHTRLSLGKIFWRETGQGEVVIFLHGTWDDSSQWSGILPYLGEKYHCFALDLLGYGESEHPKTGYSIALQVEYLREYLARFNLHKVYLVGHSLGGWLAASYALQHPEQIKGLILLSPEGVQPPELVKRWSKERALLSPIPLLYWGLKFVAPWVKLFGIAPQVQELLKLRQKLKCHPVSCRLLFQRRPVEISGEMIDRYLEKLKVPALLLQTTEDDVEAIALIRTYAALTPTAELHKLILPPQVVSPDEEIAREIQRFLTKISQSNYP